MSQFKPQFLLKPDQDIFYKLRKDDLMSLRKYLELDVKGFMSKKKIQNVVMSYLV